MIPHQTFVQDGGPSRWGIPQNESEAVEYLQKEMLFALSEVSFLKLAI